MPYICDIRTNAANNVIQAGGKLFIEGVEFTPTNLAPVAFSQGPTVWPASTASVGLQAVGQICLPRTYVRGSMGLLPASGTAGQFDSTKIACGQDVESTSFVYSASQGRYYGVAGNNTAATLSSFDASFRIANPSAVTAISLFSNSNTAMAGFVFLPLQNGRWFTMQAASAFNTTTAGLNTTNGANWSTLTEAGVWTSINAISAYPTMPYIGSDWVLIIGSGYSPTSLNVNSISAYICDRNTGTQTTLAANWLSQASPPPGIDYTQYNLCFPSNAIVATPGSEIYFYQPTMTATALNVWIGTVSGLSGTAPTISPATTAYTTTMTGGVDTTNDTITTSGDIPNLSRVRFTVNGGSAPAPLVTSTSAINFTDYWTIRVNATASRIATSYANAVAGIYIDLTTQGTNGNTLTTTRFETLNIDTSQVVFPTGVAAGSIWRNVRAWTFSNSGTNYLCIGVYEPGATNTVNTSAINLYLWRLDSKTTSTFLQRVTLGDAGRVRSLMQLNNTGKNLAVVYDGGISFWDWSSATNWTFRSTQPLQTQDVGVDAQGRVWATNTGTYAPGTPAGFTNQSLYVFEPAGAATNITVEFAQSAYTYTGPTIASNVIVNAYNVSGARVAISVTLTRDTTNFDFGGNPATTVTTSTSGNTLVPISVFGTGLLSVTAVAT